MDLKCYMVVADRLEFDGVVFKRGQLVFEELAGAEFAKAKVKGDIVQIDPFGDLNVQLTGAPDKVALGK